MAECTVWRICTDDRVERDFTIDAPTTLWLSNITEHWNREGKLNPGAMKDVFSNRIMGYSIDSRMKPQPDPRRDKPSRRPTDLPTTG